MFNCVALVSRRLRWRSKNRRTPSRTFMVVKIPFPYKNPSLNMEILADFWLIILLLRFIKGSIWRICWVV